MTTSSLKTLLVLCLASGAASAAPPVFGVTVIAPPAPWTAIYPLKVNDQGDFLALVADASGSQSFVLWRQGSGFTTVLSPDGLPVDELNGLNDSDEVIGKSTKHGFIWNPDRGGIKLFPPLGYDFALPQGINQHGQVVGYLTTKDGDKSASFQWNSKKLLEPLVEKRQSSAQAVNSFGEIAATLVKGSRNEALYAHGNSVTPLGFGSAFGGTDAIDINDLSSITLNQFSAGTNTASVWTAEHGIQSLGLPGTNAFAISNDGTIIGEIYASGSNVPGGFIWRDDYGIKRLDQTLEVGSPAISYLYGNGMAKSSGIIAAVGIVDGVHQAILLTPRAE